MRTKNYRYVGGIRREFDLYVLESILAWTRLRTYGIGGSGPDRAPFGKLCPGQGPNAPLEFSYMDQGRFAYGPRFLTWPFYPLIGHTNKDIPNIPRVNMHGLLLRKGHTYSSEVPYHCRTFYPLILESTSGGVLLKVLGVKDIIIHLTN